MLPGEGCGAGGGFPRPRALTPRFSLLQGKEMLTQKLPLWQQSCSDPNKIPDRAIQLMQQMAASSNGTIIPSALSTSKSNLIISDPIPGAKPLPVPPELAPFVGVSISVVEVVLPFRAELVGRAQAGVTAVLSKLPFDGPSRCAGTGSSVPWAVGRSLVWGWAACPVLSPLGCRAPEGQGLPGGFWGTRELDSPGQAGPRAVGLSQGTPVTTGKRLE